MKIVVIQGPNLNMLGIREQHIYGHMKLDDIHAQMAATAKQNNAEIDFFQSNLEGELVDRIQECLGVADGIIINSAAYTHTSIASKYTSQISTKEKSSDINHSSLLWFQVKLSAWGLLDIISHLWLWCRY
mgnify:CR=1 FL=1